MTLYHNDLIKIFETKNIATTVGICNVNQKVVFSSDCSSQKYHQMNACRGLSINYMARSYLMFVYCFSIVT